MADWTSLGGRLDQRLTQISGSALPQVSLTRVKAAAARWERRREVAEIPFAVRRRRIRDAAQKLKEGRGGDIPLSDLRLALFHMREEEVFIATTIARHRLVSEAISRPGKAPINILFKAFFQSFEPGSPETDRIYQHLRQNAGALRINSRAFAKAVNFFDGNYGLDSIIDSVDLRNPVRSLERVGLKEDEQDSLYGLAIKCILVERTLSHVELDAQPLKTILGWIELGERKRPDLESAYYEILLLRFAQQDPTPDIRRTIARFLLGHFGDPRSVSWPKLREDTGRLKRDTCLKVMERWLDSGALR